MREGLPRRRVLAVEVVAEALQTGDVRVAATGHAFHALGQIGQHFGAQVAGAALQGMGQIANTRGVALADGVAQIHEIARRIRDERANDSGQRVADGIVQFGQQGGVQDGRGGWGVTGGGSRLGRRCNRAGGGPFLQYLLHAGKLHRLGQGVIHAGGMALLLQLGLQIGGHGNDRHPLPGRFTGTDAARGFKTIDARHVAVHEDDRVRAGRPFVNRGLTVADHLDRAATGFQQSLGDQLVGCVVLGHQYARVVCQRRRGVERRDRWLGDLGRQIERQREPEAAANTGRAVDAYLAVHLFDQLAGDGQAKARAAELPGGRAVGLGEGLEDAFQVLAGDADAGIGDPEHQPRVRIATSDGVDLDPDFAGRGEFDRVADQIGQYLAESNRIPNHARRNVGADIDLQCDVLVACLQLEQGGNFAHLGVQIERYVLDFHAPRFQPRKIQDVVDQREQGIAGGLGDGQPFQLLGRQR